LKNPWICAACKSTVITLWTPAVSSISATSLAEIGTLGAAFLSCLAYPKYGITALIIPAELLFKASTMINNSIKLSFVGAHVGWMINTSCPLTDSVIFTLISPSLNLFTVTSANSFPKKSATFLANSGFAVPLINLYPPIFSPLIIFYNCTNTITCKNFK
jgi:hypothetical protein